VNLRRGDRSDRRSAGPAEDARQKIAYGEAWASKPP
jgi:hypothetical protein